MIGFAAAFLFCLGALGVGLFLLQKLLPDFDPCAQLGIAGLAGVGSLGTLSLFLGILPDGFKWGLAVMIPIVIFGWVWLWKRRDLFKGTKGPSGGQWFWAALLILGFLSALVGVLTPSTANDWDSIAYHMAVPKIYAMAGSIHRIVYIHHSNFPSVVELLFTWAILPLGQPWAKSFLLMGSLFGVLAVFGLTRKRFNVSAAWAGAAIFFTVPTVIWESGTAYIDVVHGLFGAIGLFILALALEEDDLSARRMILAGVMFGFACGTKYTGLVTTALAIIVFIGASIILKRRNWAKSAGIIALTAFLIGGSWYVKNIVLTGNPVYPFAYGTLGGNDWNQQRADIYRQEQLSFGVGVSPQGKDWLELGHAILGLGYQPGRYVNPLETQGGGSPQGALGIAFFAAILFWCTLKRPKPADATVLGFIGLTFLMWFGLSEQSRYLTDLLPLAAILGGAAVVEPGFGKLVGLAAGLQGLYSLYLQKALVVDLGLPVVLGRQSQTDFLDTYLPFHKAAEDINQLPGSQRVALYDQVFGYYIDKPYFWANPPHCTVIPYSSMKDGADYASDLEKQGIGWVYVQFVDPAHDRDFAASLGLMGSPQPLPTDLKSQWSADWVQQWKPLLADAVQKGDVSLVRAYRFGALLEVH